MAHFSKLNEDNIVETVVVVSNQVLIDDENNESEQQGIDFLKSIYGENTVWVQTSYNNTFRKQFAGIDFFYDQDKDVFISPKPYPSWTLNSDNDWEAPIQDPSDEENKYEWNEESQNWVLLG